MVKTELNIIIKTACQGSDNGIAQFHVLDHYAFLKQMYTNCTLVTGNLEIVGLTNEQYELIDFTKVVISNTSILNSFYTYKLMYLTKKYFFHST